MSRSLYLTKLRRILSLSRRTVGLALGILLLTAVVSAEASPEASDILVRRLVAYGAAEQAGIPEGAKLQSWSTSDGSRTTFDSWIDVRLLELERGFFETVRIYGISEGREASWLLELPSWGLIVAPEIANLEDPENLAAIESLLARSSSDVETDLRVWLHLQRAELLEEKAEIQAADDAFEEALLVSAELGTSATAAVSDERGRFLFDQQQYSRARQAYRAALDSVDEESLLTVHLLGMAVRQLFYSGEITQARTDLETLLPLVLKVAPNSLVQARYQNWLAQIYGVYGEDEKEETLLTEALALQRAHGPHDHSTLAQLLDARGNIAKKKGQWDAAIRYTREAVDLGITHQPESAGTASLLNNLGHVYISLGDLEEAGHWIQQSLELYQRVSPGLDEIIPLANLALIALERGQLIEASDLSQRSVALADELEPESSWTSAGLRVLSEVARRRGDLETARIHSNRAIQAVLAEADGGELAAEELTWHANLLRQQGEIKEARDLIVKIRGEQPPPEGPREIDAALLTSLGHLELELGNEIRTEQLWRQALEIYEAMVPGGARAAGAHARLAGLAIQRGQLKDAETSIEAGLKIAIEVLPGTLVEADLWSLRGQLEESRNQSPQALESYCRSRDSAELQREAVGGTDLDQSYFAERLQTYYRDCLRHLAQQGNTEAAFEVFEQSRGRVLRDLLGRRRADWDNQLAPKTREQLHGARRAVAGARLRLQGLGRVAPELEATRADLETAQTELAVAENLALQQAPQLAYGPQSPKVSLQEALAALPRTSTFIGYSVGAQSTWALVASVSPTDGQRTLHVRELKADQASLRTLATEFLASLDLANRVPIASLNHTGRKLHALLIEPLEDLLPPGTEIIVSPDVPLLEVPFAALVQPTSATGTGTNYLIQKYPIRYLYSLSMAALPSAVQASRDQGGIVLGLAAPTGHQPSALRELGLEDLALPGARREVEALGLQYAGNGQARTLLGKAATEAELYRLAPSAQILHFATHGVYDSAYPLASWLLLSPGEGEDGKLEAWEIVERLRTDARLATLSACESARGQPFAGEGLLGLARALHIAGARNVLASSWRINDRSTADLMAEFYRRLAAGDSEAEALRQAQISVLRRENQPDEDSTQRGVGGLAPADSSVHPFYWAAFRLSGHP